MSATESPLARICREAREHRTYVVAHPDEFTTEEVQLAKLAIYQAERLEVAAILRYGD